MSIIRKATRATASQRAAARDAGKSYREGDFVHDMQPMATKEGFRNVSGLWIGKTVPVEQAIEEVEAYHLECEDIVVPLAGIEVQGVGVVSVDGEPIRLNGAANDLARYVGLPSNLGQALPGQRGAELQAECLAHALSCSKKTARLRLHNGTLRAVVSESYAPISNRWVLKTLGGMIPGARVSHLRYDGNSISGLFLIPDALRVEQDSEYGGGVKFSNDEAGRGTLSFAPGVFRAICMNGCIWGSLWDEATLERRHRGHIPLDALRDNVASIINESVPLVNLCIDQMLSTATVEIPGAEMLLKLIASVGPQAITKAVRQAWVTGWLEEGAELSAFGLIQGLTRAARFQSATVATAMEVEAGVLVESVVSGGWHRIATRAATMNDDEVIGMLGQGLVAQVL